MVRVQGVTRLNSDAEALDSSNLNRYCWPMRVYYAGEPKAVLPVKMRKGAAPSSPTQHIAHEWVGNSV